MLFTIHCPDGVSQFEVAVLRLEGTTAKVKNDTGQIGQNYSYIFFPESIILWRIHILAFVIINGDNIKILHG